MCAVGIPGWVCLLCRHNSIDTERERAGGGCHSVASALIIKICYTMVSFVQQSFNFVLVYLINRSSGTSFDVTVTIGILYFLNVKCKFYIYFIILLDIVIFLNCVTLKED